MTQREHDKYHEVRSLVPNDWTLLTTAAAKEVKVEVAIDFGDALPKRIDDPHTVPAWHGTLLPKTDADVWLTAGCAAYECIAALEIALKEPSGGKLTDNDNDRVALALFEREAAHGAACACDPQRRSVETNPIEKSVTPSA